MYKRFIVDVEMFHLELSAEILLVSMPHMRDVNSLLCKENS